MKRLFEITLALLACAGCQQPAKTTSNLFDDHQHPQQPDAPAVHGMLVFGSEGIWLSHLPMFHKPHDYQVVMEARFTKNGADMKDLYLSDKEGSGAAYYTFVPKRFSMTHLIMGHLTSIEGSLVRGHFERGGVTIATGVVAEILSVPVATQFVSGAQKPPFAAYYVIGSEKEAFLVHQIVAKPEEFDQVLAVRLSESLDPGTLLSTIVPNHPDDRLLAGHEIKALTPDDATVVVEVGSEVYLETGDLEM